MTLISIDAVRKRYGENEVLKGIDMRIDAGEVIAIIGKSGSGKSTLLRCVNGLESIQDGAISVGETRLYGSGKVGKAPDEEATLRALRRKVGMIFQQFNLFPHLSVGANVMLAPMRVLRQSRNEAHEVAKRELRRVGLENRFDSFPDQLSGGQQQRVAIARALAMAPSALLCDEITSALDPELVNEVLSVMRELASDGMTLMMVTHEMRFAREVCDRVVFMHHGLVHEQGAPEQVFCAPQTSTLRQFLGHV